MLYELENNLDTLLASKIGGDGGFYHHEINPIVRAMLDGYSFQNQLTALGEIEGSETAGNYAQTLGESVPRALTELLTKSSILRLEKAREDFKVTKAAVLEEGYVLVSYYHGDKRYYGMAKPGEPTEFLDSEYAAVMSVRPIESFDLKDALPSTVTEIDGVVLHTLTGNGPLGVEGVDYTTIKLNGVA